MQSHVNLMEEPSSIRLAPALYVFGDSVVDSGNNNHLPTQAKSNFLPYGVDFNGKPTGRFTNGRTIADYFANLLGLPFAPPYLGLSKSQRRTIVTGMNYASGSCGILRETGKIAGMCLSLDNQINLFQQSVKNDLPSQIKNQLQLRNHLSKSLFLVSMGSNDYFLNYLTAKDGMKPPPEVFAQFLLAELSIRLRRLYTLGARKFLVNNIGPIGCIPGIINTMKPRGECVVEVNGIVLFYSMRLPLMLRQLQSQLPGAIFINSDNFLFVTDIRRNPEKFGLTDMRNPCCIDAGNGTLPCTPNKAPCKTRNEHMFFDAFHPREAVNAIFARRCFNESSICTPFNLKQLMGA